MEGPAEDTVGRGAEEERKEETLVHDPGYPCRQVVQPGGIGLALYFRCGKASAGEELPLFLPMPSFMASADGEQGARYDFLCPTFGSDSFPL